MQLAVFLLPVNITLGAPELPNPNTDGVLAPEATNSESAPDAPSGETSPGVPAAESGGSAPVTADDASTKRAGASAAAQQHPSVDPLTLKQMVKEAIREHEQEERQKRIAASMRKHDGFYFRLSINAGYAIDHAEDNGVAMESHGFGGFLGYAFGVTLGEHVVFAFAHDMVGVFSPSTTVGGARFSPDHSAFYQVFGLAFDYFPDPHGGFHFGGTIGPGMADMQRIGDEDTHLDLVRCSAPDTISGSPISGA